MRFLGLFCFLPMLAFGQRQELNIYEVTVTRAQAHEAGIRLTVAARELDEYLASDSAKRFESDVEDMPPEVIAILQQAGLDPDEMEFGAENHAAMAALGFAVFKVCDREYVDLLHLRTHWVERAYDSWLLTLDDDDLAEFSRRHANAARVEFLPILMSYVDSWLAIAATHAGCEQEALGYAEFARADSTHDLGGGILGMARSGLLVRAAKSGAGVERALDARASAMSELLRAGSRLAALSVRKGWETQETAAELLQDFIDYDEEFKRTLSRAQSPVWNVEPDSNPKVDESRRHCGFGDWYGHLIAAFMMPHWPTVLDALSKQGQEQSAAAYALAGLFDSRERLSVFNSHVSGDIETQDLVWRAYGKAETKAELERAVDRITLSARESGIAVIRLFGHEFLLSSAKVDMKSSIRWFTLDEIKANFRKSIAFQTLVGEQSD